MSFARKLAIRLLGVESIEKLIEKEITNDQVTELALKRFNLSEVADLVVNKSGSHSFTEFALDYVAVETNRTGALLNEVKRLVREHTAGARVNPTIEGIAVSRIVADVKEIEAGAERNILKRKSYASKAIRSQLPDIGKADLNYLVEVLVQYVKQLKV